VGAGRRPAVAPGAEELRRRCVVWTSRSSSSVLGGLERGPEDEAVRGAAHARTSTSPHAAVVRIPRSRSRPSLGPRRRSASPTVTSWNFPPNVSNAKMWISKFRFEIECIIKM
jgi:hypothetical protein